MKRDLLKILLAVLLVPCLMFVTSCEDDDDTPAQTTEESTTETPPVALGKPTLTGPPDPSPIGPATVTWTPVDNAKEYGVVAKYDDGTGTWVTFADDKSGNTQKTVTIPPAASGSMAVFEVRAIDKNGNKGPMSDPRVVNVMP